MEKRQLAIVAALTALNFIMVELWMMATKHTYARLHIIVIAPILFLSFVPPRPLSKFDPTVRIVFCIATFLLCLVALIFSVWTWDRELWVTETIFLLDVKESFGEFMDCPVEEILWCVDHTLLVAVWIASIWRIRPVLKMQGNAQFGLRIAATIIFALVSYTGYILMNKEDKYFFLGLELFWMFLVLAYLSAFCAHIYVPYARECILGTLLPGAYTAALDAWAAHRGVWGTSDRFILGIRHGGLIFEQALVYFLTSAIAAVGVVAYLRLTEVYVAIRPKVKGSFIKVCAITLVWGEERAKAE